MPVERDVRMVLGFAEERAESARLLRLESGLYKVGDGRHTGS